MVIKVLHIVLVCLTAIFIGCNPYRFSIQTSNPVECRIFSDHNSVKSQLYGFQMNPESVVQITSLGWTQYDFGAYFNFSGGEGFQVMLRPTVEESVIDSGLILTFFSSGGMRLDSAGKLLEENSSFRFPKDSQTFVTVYNEEAYLRVTVGCDTVFKRFTKRKSSDDIVLKTLTGSKLNIMQPQWKQVKFVKNFEVLTEETRNPHTK
jgi:hypothetical protein